MRVQSWAPEGSIDLDYHVGDISRLQTLQLRVHVLAYRLLSSPFGG